MRSIFPTLLAVEALSSVRVITIRKIVYQPPTSSSQKPLPIRTTSTRNFLLSASSSRSTSTDPEGGGTHTTVPPPKEQEKEEPERSIRRTLTLVDEATGTILARGVELEPLPAERDKPDEDELEILYPTQRQFFQFAPTNIGGGGGGGRAESMTSPAPLVQKVRTTSFGCSKLGHQVWPSSMALCLWLVHEYYGAPAGDNQEELVQEGVAPIPPPPPPFQTVLELGAGCGLPSIVCRDVLQIPMMIATDFWYHQEMQPFGSSMSSAEERDKGRLIPEVWHGINLKYNVEQHNNQAGRAQVQRADWHDVETVRQAAAAAAGVNNGTNGKSSGLDLVIGSDLIYYGMDVEPLWNAIDTLLQDCGAKQVVLISPLLDTRDSLPIFLELLDSKTDMRNDDDDDDSTEAAAAAGRQAIRRGRARYHLHRQELHLYKSTDDFEARQDADRFVKLTLTPRSTSSTSPS